jgi:hypothetical protein
MPHHPPMAKAFEQMFAQHSGDADLAHEVAQLRKEIAALRAELAPVHSLILTGRQHLDEFKKLSRAE